METLIDNEEYQLWGNWIQCWKLKIPQRVKNFYGELYEEFYQQEIGSKRKVYNARIYAPTVKTTFENEWHLFWGCNQAKEVAQRCDLVMMLWCLWKHRNENIWEDTVRPVRVSIQLARDLLYQWCVVREKEGAAASIPNATTAARWQPPMEGEVKCNIDATLFNDQQKFGIGMCIRDDQGAFVKARTMCFDGTPSPLEAEAWAVKETITWLGGLELSRVVIEVDCLLVVNVISDKIKNITDLGNVLKECRRLLENYPNFKIVFVRRQADFVAHKLARTSIYYASHQTFDLIPFCIVPILMNEKI